MKTRKHTTAYKDESRLFYIAASCCLVVFCAYVYFLSNSIMNVVMRKEVDAQIASLGTAVGQLEASYIERQHLVSNNIASQKGYVAASTKVFIDTAEDTLVLSTN